MTAEVALGHAGIVFGLEVSRGRVEEWRHTLRFDLSVALRFL
jgi:hypothetical protein